MPRADPNGRYDKVCKVCSTEFTTHKPKAVRCPVCITEGRHSPPPKTRAKKPKPAPVLHSKTCMACGSEFTTHKAKAVRCPSCIFSNTPVRQRKCTECGSGFNLAHDDHSSIRCEPCAAFLGLDQIELSPVQLEAERQEQRRERRRDLLARQAAWLDEREKRTPKGTRMTNAVRSKPIGQLWLQVCAHDGAAHALTYAGATADLTEHEKVALLTSYVKLRLKGYRSEQIERLCPEALLQEGTQDALSCPSSGILGQMAT